jgi:predicted glycoside hydrolase/deacetylase ChbG (UPF0249 family)
VGGGLGWKAAILRFLARGAPARIAEAGLRRPDALYATALTQSRDFGAALWTVLENAGPGVSEIALHPGYAAPAIRGLDAYQDRREEEMRALRGEGVRALLADPRLKLISFRELAEGGAG